jgi:hypothetical protein
MPVVIKFKTGTTEADQNSPRPLSKSQEIPQESSTKPEKLKLLQSLFSLNKNAKSNDDELDILIDFTMIKEEDPNPISLEQVSPRNFDKSREVFYVAVLVDSIKEKLEFVSKEKLQEHANDQYVHNKEQLMKVSEDLERERGILKVSHTNHNPSTELFKKLGLERIQFLFCTFSLLRLICTFRT